MPLQTLRVDADSPRKRHHTPHCASSSVLPSTGIRRYTKNGTGKCYISGIAADKKRSAFNNQEVVLAYACLTLSRHPSTLTPFNSHMHMTYCSHWLTNLQAICTYESIAREGNTCGCSCQATHSYILFYTLTHEPCALMHHHTQTTVTYRHECPQPSSSAHPVR